jgi:predicted transposase/invertase (TIGR01784 family)
MSRKEIEEMFRLSDLKQTRVYQEAKQEGLQEGKQEGLQEGSLKAKLAAVSRLLALGLTVEQIAQALDLNVEQVRQATQGD